MLREGKRKLRYLWLQSKGKFLNLANNGGEFRFHIKPKAEAEVLFPGLSLSSIVVSWLSVPNPRHSSSAKFR